MKAVLQRVSKASVSVDGSTVGICHGGWFILLGVGPEDSMDDINFLVKKIIELRAFPNEQGAMDLDIKAIDGEALVVSQFTLFADLSKGRRPSFKNAAEPELAKKLYETFVKELQSQGIKVQTGVFGAKMLIHTNCEGPVTFVLDSKES